MEDNAVARFLAGAFLFCIYFLPTLIAKGNKHPRLEALGLLNLFLGWTVLGWIGALGWALSKRAEPAPARPLTQADQLAALDKRWDRGEINNAQYLHLKEQLLKNGANAAGH